eukprot:XP_022270177.1 putative uncharacterized protein C6orf52 homolog isoform X3 [Canis lupus familiaris]
MGKSGVEAPLYLPALWGSQCSGPARVTPPAPGLSNSTVATPFLSTAVAVQQMEVEANALCGRPLDAQLNLWSRLRKAQLWQRNKMKTHLKTNSSPGSQRPHMKNGMLKPTSS